MRKELDMDRILKLAGVPPLKPVETLNESDDSRDSRTGLNVAKTKGEAAVVHAMSTAKRNKDGKFESPAIDKAVNQLAIATTKDYAAKYAMKVGQSVIKNSKAGKVNEDAEIEAEVAAQGDDAEVEEKPTDFDVCVDCYDCVHFGCGTEFEESLLKHYGDGDKASKVKTRVLAGYKKMKEMSGCKNITGGRLSDEHSREECDSCGTHLAGERHHVKCH